MMAALKASGLPIVSNVRLDDFTAQHPMIDGYKPTKGLLLEAGRAFYMHPKVMRKFVRENDEIGIKVFFDGLPILPVGEYTVIFMQRDADEIIESLARVDRYKRSYNSKGTSKVFEERDDDRSNRYPFDVYSKYRPDDVEQCLEIVKQRRDVEVVEVQFSDLIKDPVKTLQSIRKTPLGRVRVPIDVDKAAAIIDPDWYRCVA